MNEVTDEQIESFHKNGFLVMKGFYDQNEINEIRGWVYDYANRKSNEWIAGNLSYHLEERPKWIYEKNISARWMDNYNKMLKTTTIWRLRISINVDTTLLRDTVGVIELRV